jgi:DNA polymerase-3 subunit gamma/tau
MLETLGQAVVDMRGTDAADPRLVVEIALVRLARREAGTPLQALAERIDRLERAAVASPTAGAPTAPGPSERPSGRSGRSFAELRRDRQSGSAAPAAAPAEPAPAAPEPVADDPPAAAPVADVDIDDVIVAWAEIIDDLPPATKAAVRDAQPLALDDGVITFGVPRAQYDVAVPRFRKEADNIRAALSRRLGREMKFKPVAHDFGSDPAPASNEPLDEEPPDDDEIDLADLVDGDGGAPAVDSVTLITQSLGATVVEEVPRD